MNSPLDDRDSFRSAPRWGQLLVGGTFVLCAAVASAQTIYDVTDIGILPGGVSSEARAVNNQGVVVGVSDAGISWQRAFVWENGVLTELPGGPPNVRSWANDINDAGQIAGVIMNDGVNQMATLWENRNPISLGSFGGTQSGAMKIDQSGRVVGWAMFSPDPTNRRYRPFLYENGVMTNLGLAPSEPYAEATAISDNGQFIVGDGPISQRSAQMNGPLVFDSINGVSPLGTLGGRSGSCRAVNDNGWMVGATDNGILGATGYYCDHAFLYRDEKMIDLGVVYGNASRAYAVNNLNVIVGTSWDSNAIPWAKRGFVRFDTQMIDLNTLLPPGSPWRIIDAFDINDNGQIVGSGQINGATHAVLLTPR